VLYLCRIFIFRGNSTSRDVNHDQKIRQIKLWHRNLLFSTLILGGSQAVFWPYFMCRWRSLQNLTLWLSLFKDKTYFKKVIYWEWFKCILSPIYKSKIRPWPPIATVKTWALCRILWERTKYGTQNTASSHGLTERVLFWRAKLASSLNLFPSSACHTNLPRIFANSNQWSIPPLRCQWISERSPDDEPRFCAFQE
jgi:hypothetical protein